MSLDLINSNLLNDDLIPNNKYYKNNFYNASGDSESNPEGEAEYENEDYTEYENEESEIGDTTETDLPKFRTLVRNKKLELNTQYGKAHIEKTTREVCVNVPYTKWDSNINCSNVCVKWNWKLECTERKEKCLGGFIGGTRRECANVPYFKWVSGWRKKWREFKRNGGLAELKLQSKGLLPINTPNIIQQPIQAKPSRRFALMAEEAVINPLFLQKAIESSSDEDYNKNEDKPATDYDVVETEKRASNTDNNKILGMPKDIAITVGVVVLALGTFAIIRKIMK